MAPRAAATRPSPLTSTLPGPSIDDATASTDLCPAGSTFVAGAGAGWCHLETAAVGLPALDPEQVETLDCFLPV